MIKQKQADSNQSYGCVIAYSYSIMISSSFQFLYVKSSASICLLAFFSKNTLNAKATKIQTLVCQPFSSFQILQLPFFHTYRVSLHQQVFPLQFFQACLSFLQVPLSLWQYLLGPAAMPSTNETWFFLYLSLDYTLLPVYGPRLWVQCFFICKWLPPLWIIFTTGQSLVELDLLVSRFPTSCFLYL